MPRAAASAARDKHRKAGKLLARERIAALLDPGSPFLELSALAAQGVYGAESAGGGSHHRHRPGFEPRMHGGCQ